METLDLYYAILWLKTTFKVLKLLSIINVPQWYFPDNDQMLALISTFITPEECETYTFLLRNW